MLPVTPGPGVALPTTNLSARPTPGVRCCGCGNRCSAAWPAPSPCPLPRLLCPLRPAMQHLSSTPSLISLPPASLRHLAPATSLPLLPRLVVGGAPPAPSITHSALGMAPAAAPITPTATATPTAAATAPTAPPATSMATAAATALNMAPASVQCPCDLMACGSALSAHLCRHQAPQLLPHHQASQLLAASP